MKNYSRYQFLFDNGNSNLATLSAKLSRFSAGPNTIFPRNGSTFSLYGQVTPPYSLLSGTGYGGSPRRTKIQMD